MEQNLLIPHRELFNELVLLCGERIKEPVKVMERKVFKALSSQQGHRRRVDEKGPDKVQLDKDQTSKDQTSKEHTSSSQSTSFQSFNHIKDWKDVQDFSVLWPAEIHC